MRGGGGSGNVVVKRLRWAVEPNHFQNVKKEKMLPILNRGNRIKSLTLATSYIVEAEAKNFKAKTV